MSIFLNGKTSKRRLQEARNAQRNRREILKALADGQITRRELIKWGLFTGAGVLAMKNGLSPFVGSAYADSVPTGLPPSPLFGVRDFSTPMPRFDVRPRGAVVSLSPLPSKGANTAAELLDPRLLGVVQCATGIAEGGAPGALWAHQRF